MAWQPHDKDNNPRTPSQYVRNDINCNPVVGPIGTYERNDINCDPDATQPTATTVTDPYGNTYSNWNGDYVDSPLNPPSP